MPEEVERKLTDGDVKAIVAELEAMVVQRFYNDLGRGVFSLAWKAILIAIVGVAAYGQFKGIK